MLSRGLPDAGIGAALFGTASMFMAHEGFQLLTYDYKDIETTQKTLPRAVLSAIVIVIVVYVVVALIVRLIATDALALVFLGLLVLVASFGRPALLRHVKTESRHR
jgi:L-asparagine transporter-like permease